jgi:hypothetical protein
VLTTAPLAPLEHQADRSQPRHDKNTTHYAPVKPGNGDAVCGNDAALHPERADGSLPLRAQVGPWASVGFNLGRSSPLIARWADDAVNRKKGPASIAAVGRRPFLSHRNGYPRR